MENEGSFRFISAMHNLKRVNFGTLIQNLTHSEFMALGIIRNKELPKPPFLPKQKKPALADKDVSVSDIADILHISSPAVSKMVSNLEERGLVERYSGGTDRRNTYVKLTEEGEKICIQNEKQMELFFDKVIEYMGKDEMEQLSALTTRLKDSMERVIEEEQRAKEGETKNEKYY